MSDMPDDPAEIISDFSSNNEGEECGDVLTGNLLIDSDVEKLITIFVYN